MKPPDRDPSLPRPIHGSGLRYAPCHQDLRRSYSPGSGSAGALRGFSNNSSALPAITNANAPVICVAAPRPPPPSSFSAASPATCGRTPNNPPPAGGSGTFSRAKERQGGGEGKDGTV